MIHPTAIVDPDACLASGVEVGPWTSISAGVEIDAGTRIGAHVIIEGPTRIGRDNRLHPFSVVGGAPQDRKYAGEASRLELGDRNTVREYCTLNRGTAPGGGITRIGDDNWIMAYVHVAHDCQVGSGNVMANATTLAGHVEVGDHVTFGALTVVHQFCRLGSHGFTAMGTVVLKDVPPFVTASGNPARAHGINAEGLRRRGFDPAAILRIRRAYKTVYRQGMKLADAAAELEGSDDASVVGFGRFLRESRRGVVR